MSIFSKKCLGIDIGAASIKMVEISVLGKKKKLENYARFSLDSTGSSFKTFQGQDMFLLAEQVSNVLKAILKKAQVKEKEAALSIPDFSTFFTTFSLPPMSKTEVSKAVEFEARHHIPLPLSEVIFDWQIIEEKEVLPGLKLKILLVAVPNRVLLNYKKMADLSELRLKGMEAEVFGLIRSSIGGQDKDKTLCLLDIGWQSTTVSIVEKTILQASYSFDVSGRSLTEALSKEMKIGWEEAEALKRKHGLDPQRQDIVRALLPQLNSLSFEIEKIWEDYSQNNNKEVEKIILAGGSASLFGLKEYLESRLKKKTEIANPFNGFNAPPVLHQRLEELGPSFATALGVALMGIEG